MFWILQGRQERRENNSRQKLFSLTPNKLWHGTAKMIILGLCVINYLMIGFGASGQAFVIFKTRDAAVSAIRKLEEGCLLLSNGRYVYVFIQLAVDVFIYIYVHICIIIEACVSQTESSWLLTQSILLCNCLKPVKN